MSLSQINNDKWDLVIKAKSSVFNIDFSSLWKYRDLIYLFVKRDFISQYKQTILGPLWFFIQPILTTLIFTVVFGNMAKIPTDGIPPFIFFLAGTVGWNYFADCLSKTSTTFTSNAHIFGKVYFPRLIVPLSIIFSNLMKFFVQFMILAVMLIYYKTTGEEVKINRYVLLTPLLLILMAGLGLGFGIIITSLTTKYRDLQFLVAFGVQLLMYATPVVYPISFVPEQYRLFILLNPMSTVIETFRYAFLGAGELSWFWLMYSILFMLVLLIISLLIFSRVEKTFTDTV